MSYYSDYNLVSPGTTSSECYTPLEIIRAAHVVLGGSGIYFDPASCSRANDELVCAKVFYSLEKGENGLSLPWHDGMWLNPPYGKGVTSWLTRAYDYYVEGLFDNYGALVLARGDSFGLRLLQENFPFILCRRISFLRLVGDKLVPGENPLPGTCIFFLGNEKKYPLFKQEFGKFGIPLKVF
jgi:hypothetical protein